MFNRIIDILDSEVKPSLIIAASAVADDDPYDGIPCYDDGHPRSAWCNGCEARGTQRDADAIQLSMPPLPAEAVCDDDGYPDFTPRQLAAMALLNAIDDDELMEVDSWME